MTPRRSRWDPQDSLSWSSRFENHCRQPNSGPCRDNGRQIPPDADRQGFLGYPGARCNYTNPAVVIGRTTNSALVICETGAGRYYYKGIRLQNGGLSVEIDDPTQTGSGFVATNNGEQYSVSPGALVITQGSRVLSNEPMVEYWSAYRPGTTPNQVHTAPNSTNKYDRRRVSSFNSIFCEGFA